MDVLVTLALAWLVPVFHPTASAGVAVGERPGLAAARAGCAVSTHLRARLTLADGVPPETAASVRDVVDRTWRPEGLSFDWSEGTADADPWRDLDVWIAIVPGMPATSDGGLMGEVLFHGALPHRMIRVSLDAAIHWVRRDQASRFGTTTTFANLTLGRTAELVPRALGYIVAHEIGHVALGTRNHARSGVMQATYSGAARLLTTPGALTLDPVSRARLRARLADIVPCQ